MVASFLLQRSATPSTSRAGYGPANRPSPRCEKRVASAFCSLESTCTAKCRAARNVCKWVDVLPRLHSTKGGERETELNLFAVTPMPLPAAPTVVTRVAPVGKVPRAVF